MRHLKNLIQRRPDVVRLITHVSDKKTPILRHGAVEVNQLACIGIRARCIDQHGGYAESAFGEGLLRSRPMRCNSASVAGRSSIPMTQSRTLPCPTRVAMLTLGRGKRCRYCSASCQ